MEDAQRVKSYLPMAKMHAAAAGANAETAVGLYHELGGEKYAEQIKSASAVLEMERVQWNAAYRGQKFHYAYTIG